MKNVEQTFQTTIPFLNGKRVNYQVPTVSPTELQKYPRIVEANRGSLASNNGNTGERPSERGRGKDDNIKKAYRNVRRKGLLAWRSCGACLHQRRPLLNSLFPFYLNPRRHLVTTSTSINYHWRPFALPRLCTQPDTHPRMCTLGTFTTCEFLHRWLLTSITISNGTHCDARSNLHID